MHEGGDSRPRLSVERSSTGAHAVASSSRHPVSTTASVTPLPIWQCTPLCASMQNFCSRCLKKKVRGEDWWPSPLSLTAMKTIACGMLSKQTDAWHIACTQPLVGFLAGPIFRSMDSPEEQNSTLSASRAALRCNRIQLDAEEAGPTSPVFFFPSAAGFVNPRENA